MIPHDSLTKILEDALSSHRKRGELTWQRTSDWVKAHNPPLPGIRGGGFMDGARPERDEIEAELDWRAGQYHHELTALTERLVADLRRLTIIEAACTPVRPKNLGTRDMLVAQVAADGWCVSCWRNEQHLTPHAEGRYRDLCRFCGDWKGEHGATPPVAILRLKHDMRTITTAAVLEAMGKAG